jgi:queuine tRNA-ribosyltransferase subunit QTRTD1
VSVLTCDGSQKLLPEEKPRMVMGSYSPLEVLELVSHGIDLINSAYPNMVADLAYALAFAVDVPVTAESTEHKMEVDERSDLHDNNKLNLRDICYRLDVQPVLPGCDCYTCTKHTRAYIHHLLNTHEMLANVLLTT